MKVNLTGPQRDAVESRGRTLIVSAGAGAGKTATLVQRILALLTDEEHPASLDDMLIVTFTRAAAQEMKERIALKLTEEAARKDITDARRERLREQLYMISRAHISTIHSFCLDLITAHPEQAGLAPDFDLMGEEEQRLFRAGFVEDYIEEILSGGGDRSQPLARLLKQFHPMNGPARLHDLIIAQLAFLDSLPNPRDLLERTEDMYFGSGSDGLFSQPRGKELVAEELRRLLREQVTQLDAVLAFPRAALSSGLVAQYDAIAAVRARLVSAAEDARDEARFPEFDGEFFSLPRLSMPKPPTPEDTAFRAVRDRTQKLFKKWQERLAHLSSVPIDLQLEESRGIAKYFVKTLGIELHKRLFDEHLNLRRITFAHLERIAQRLLSPESGETGVSDFYRQKFQHVFIDEFQDVNELQKSLLGKLSRGFGHAGNLFVVGDVKQSIYEFRLANPQLFQDLLERGSAPLDRSATTRDAARVLLNHNFRTQPRLLDEINGMFSALMRPDTIGFAYTPDHAMLAGRMEEQFKRPAAMHLHIVPSAGSYDADLRWEETVSPEAVHVAELIESLDCDYSDICILLRATTGIAAEIVAACEARGIPTFCDARMGFLSAVEVVEFQTILRAIDNPYDDVALVGTLRGPAARWSENDLLELRLVSRERPFCENLRAAAADESSVLHARTSEFLQRHAEWQRRSTTMNMEDFFQHLFDDLHLLEVAAVRPGGTQRRLNLLALLDRARQFDGFLRNGLGKFLRFLDDLIARGHDYSPPSPLPENANVVRIMSVHQSKGMEFPVVIVPNTARGFNYADTRGEFLFDKDLGVVTRLVDRDPRPDDEPPALYKVFQERRKRRLRLEALRLLYVAMTRAEEQLYLIGAPSDWEKLCAKTIESAEAPAPFILSADCWIEWLALHAHSRVGLDAISEAPAAGSAGIYEVRVFSREEMLTSCVPRGGADPESATVPPSPGDDYHEALARIELLGSRPEDASIRAKVSVSELKRAWDAVRDPETPPYPRPRTARQESPDWWPEALDAAPQQVVGASRGTATHRFLANCEMEEVSQGRRRLTEELKRLTAEGIVSGEEAAAIRLEEIAWFLNSPLGKRMRLSATKLERERPFTVRLTGDEVGAPGMDGETVILQGVVDLLFREGDGWILIDFKTDTCGEENARIDSLVESYTPQLELYQLMVERALGAHVKEAWLVFLTGQECRRVEPESSPAQRWARAAAGALLMPAPAEGGAKRRPSV